jgi:hypothetical protein
MITTKRESYPDELSKNNKTLVISDEHKLINNDKKNNDNNTPRQNEFLRDFCIWRKSQGLFVPVTWEK